MKKIIIAPNSFKGSLSSVEVADAMEIGVKKVFPNCNAIKIPIADGGDGTMDTLVSALRGKVVTIDVHDPLMRPIKAEYGLIDKGKTAIIEVSRASGLTLLNKEEQCPAHTNTFGTGEIIKDALNRGCRKVIIGLGGSATNDAGIGMLKALGFRFLDLYGKEVIPNGESLRFINKIDESKALASLKLTQFIVACDINNPFSGPQGAAFIFAPQKGANQVMVENLNEGLEVFRKLIFREKNINLNAISGTGAAGGMGGGLVALLNAQLTSGIDLILEIVKFEKHLNRTDLIITGEGKLDRQTIMGKAASGILTKANKKGVPVIAIGGSVEDITTLTEYGFTAVFSTISQTATLEELMQKDNAKNNIAQTTEQVLNVIKQYKK